MTHLEGLFAPPSSEPGSSGAGDVPPKKPPRSWKKGTLLEQMADQTSKGDIKTIRSQLHTRRATLNEQIEKEDRIKDGTKKLIGATRDHRTKDQATLEMNFSESKIKALQAELTKINSSLSAYQAVGCDTVQVPLIPLAMKVTNKISFVTAFSDIISAHYHEDPSELLANIYEFQEMRNGILSITRDEAGVKKLFEYHSHLQLMTKRFINPVFKHGLSFVWYDAINGLPSEQRTAIFERACVLFNIASLYTQLAAGVDRTSPEDIDEAIHLLEKAIGMLEYIREKFANPPSRDLSREMLTMFADLMRAQAQELQWEKMAGECLLDTVAVVIDHAHKTKCIADCYRPVKECMELESVKSYLPECWVTLVKVKDAHYRALAHYYAALAHEQSGDILAGGGEIGEDVRTELHFLYIESPPEMNTGHSSFHFGLMQSHLNCASLSHEYAVKYNSLCRDLHHVLPLTKMLAEAAGQTALKKEDADKMDSMTIIAPTLQASGVTVSASPPKPSSVKVPDVFHILGPLPRFSAENRWSIPRVAIVQRDSEGGLGISIRKSHPVIMSGIDEGGPAEAAGVKENDWLLAVNGNNVKYKSHDQVVSMIKTCGDVVTFEVATPETSKS